MGLNNETATKQQSGGNSVLAIVLGIVGEPIALLLIAVPIVFIISKVVQRESAIQEHGYVDLLQHYTEFPVYNCCTHE